MEVGFLGLGIMGKAMSLNLLRHAFEVTVWNRTLSKMTRFSIGMGNNRPFSREGRFLEAPVSGSKKPAEDGQLLILAAGDKDELLKIPQLW
ncbi:hypothetical protein K1719_042123 [Acacia pycnantha]|nr:hypothetical protein K1719_042123 [Acacia pycnantha]